MCRCSDAELNCVSRYTRFRSELMQFEIGMSTMRYLPARGTAGLARSFVSGKSRVPAPPPMMTDSTRLELGDMRDVPGVEAMENSLVATLSGFRRGRHHPMRPAAGLLHGRVEIAIGLDQQPRHFRPVGLLAAVVAELPRPGAEHGCLEHALA